jgi:hypothetical protein
MLMRSALRLTFIALGACAYTGLAIVGWGGFRPFFSHPTLIALVVVLFAALGRIVLRRRKHAMPA